MLLGFARLAGFPDWPARVEGEAGTSRLKVAFLGTTRTSIIAKTAFTPYTSSHLRRVSTPANLRKGAFKAATKELKKLAESSEKVPKVKDSEGKKNDTKKGLRKQKEENDRKFSSTMVKLLARRVWACRRCPFRTGLRFKARTHAITCNSMVRKRRGGRLVGMACLLCPHLPQFRGKQALTRHGYKEHRASMSFICVKGHSKPVSFTRRRDYFRHQRECHPTPQSFSSRFYCSHCSMSYTRRHGLNRWENKYNGQFTFVGV